MMSVTATTFFDCPDCHGEIDMSNGSLVQCPTCFVRSQKSLAHVTYTESRPTSPTAAEIRQIVREEIELALREDATRRML